MVARLNEFCAVPKIEQTNLAVELRTNRMDFNPTVKMLEFGGIFAGERDREAADHESSPAKSSRR